MSALPPRPDDPIGELKRLAESGGLDELAWALTRLALAAAQDLAPGAKTPAEAAWIVARRADPSLRPTEPPPAPGRAHRARVRPSRLARWEAHWQAEADAEDDPADDDPLD